MQRSSPKGLTQSTQIPTHARGQVRALVKAHKDWKAFLEEKGTISASAKNADLIQFALRHPELTAQIETLLMPIRPVIPASAAVPMPETTVHIIERLLREFYSRQGEKPRIRRPMGRAA